MADFLVALRRMVVERETDAADAISGRYRNLASEVLEHLRQAALADAAALERAVRTIERHRASLREVWREAGYSEEEMTAALETFERHEDVARPESSGVEEFIAL